MRSSFEPGPAVRRAVFVAEGSDPARAADTREARGEAETVLEERYAQGREDARAELEADAHQRVSSAVGALERARAELARVTLEEREALRTAVVELALALAGRLVARELRDDCETLAPLVEEALTLLPASEEMTFALSNTDAERVKDGQAPELERLRSEWSVELVADPTLAPGEVVVRSGAASVDLRIETVLKRFREGLSERMPLAEDPK